MELYRKASSWLPQPFPVAAFSLPVRVRGPVPGYTALGWRSCSVHQKGCRLYSQRFSRVGRLPTSQHQAHLFLVEAQLPYLDHHVLANWHSEYNHDKKCNVIKVQSDAINSHFYSYHFPLIESFERFSRSRDVGQWSGVASLSAQLFFVCWHLALWHRRHLMPSR